MAENHEISFDAFALDLLHYVCTTFVVSSAHAKNDISWFFTICIKL